MSTHRIYNLTSIGRPVDWHTPTNRAMVILLAPAAVGAIVLGVLQGAALATVLGFALHAVLAGFGGWALGRELDPDHQASAFAAMALAVFVLYMLGPVYTGHSILVLLTTLGLVRQVNRTTGLESRLSDSLVLMALTLWVIYATANPLFGLVAALSFAFDGSLDRPQRRQYVFALASVGATIVYMVDHDSSLQLLSAPQSLPQWLAALAVLVFGLNVLLLDSVASVCDVRQRNLDLRRVRAGATVALVAVAQGLPQVREVALLAAVLAGVCLAAAFRRSFRNPA